MSIEATQEQATLTQAQLDTIERARNTPFVISRSRRRPADEKRWTFKPRMTLARDVDVLELLDRGWYPSF